MAKKKRPLTKAKSRKQAIAIGYGKAGKVNARKKMRNRIIRYEISRYKSGGRSPRGVKY